MADARNLPQAIQWHEGMLLAPQHFQQLSFRWEELLHYQITAASPFHWGLRHLKVDHPLLADGIFRVVSLEAIMPDGLAASFDLEDREPLEIDFSPFLEEMRQAALTVHLVVPVKTAGSAAVESGQPRYISVEGKPVVDENTGLSALSIPSLKPRLGLLITPKTPARYTSLPLAKIKYKDDAPTLSAYIPPCLNVIPKSPLWEMCSAVSRKIRSKVFFLSEKAHSPAVMAREFQALETRLLIQAMVSSLPRFEAILYAGRSHPFILYLSLCQLAGGLSALGSGLIPPVFSAYNHNDPRASYLEVINFIDRMMEEGVNETHTAISFTQAQAAFSLNLKSAWAARSLLIGARLKPGVSEEAVGQWLDECIIGSSPLIENMRTKRILGPDRTRVEDPGDLVPPRGVILFAVKRDPEFIKLDQTLMVFNLADPQGRRSPAELLLFVRNRPGAEAGKGDDQCSPRN